MGLFDNIPGIGNQNSGGGQNPLLAALLALLTNQQSGGLGGLGGLIQKLNTRGLGNIASSWVSTGNNLPITPEQVHQGLGNDTIAELSSRSGLPPEQVTSQLSGLLPNIVDQLTPNGKVDQGDLVSRGMDLLKGLMR